jgi:hypothetical protein
MSYRAQLRVEALDNAVEVTSPIHFKIALAIGTLLQLLQHYNKPMRIQIPLLLMIVSVLILQACQSDPTNRERT